MTPKFSLCQVGVTPAALQAILDAGQSLEFFLARHVQGDWGEVDESDKRANDHALLNGERLLSAYTTLLGVRIWIITEAADDQGQRVATTVLLSEEY